MKFIVTNHLSPRVFFATRLLPGPGPCRPSSARFLLPRPVPNEPPLQLGIHVRRDVIISGLPAEDQARAGAVLAGLPKSFQEGTKSPCFNAEEVEDGRLPFLSVPLQEESRSTALPGRAGTQSNGAGCFRLWPSLDHEKFLPINLGPTGQTNHTSDQQNLDHLPLFGPVGVPRHELFSFGLLCPEHLQNRVPNRSNLLF